MIMDKQIATFFGIGYTPIAPGTAGALAGGVLFYLIIFILNKIGLSFYSTQWIMTLLTVVVLLVSVKAIKNLNGVWQHDAQQIVIDEVVGVWIAMLFIPVSWLNYLIAFVLFRIFDITKPFFIKKIDRLKSSWSVLLDDVVAGLYANLVLQLIIYLSF
jgi:phosphatidylglycerophosphatase A